MNYSIQPVKISTDIHLARQKFPRGLSQPEKSYQFGLDALLLGAFAAKLVKKNSNPASIKIAELGCGCGAALFSCLLLESEPFCLGIDKEEELIECARRNAISLGFANTNFIKCELGQLAKEMTIRSWLRSCDFVLANPPWRSSQEKKRSRYLMRNEALWAKKDTFELFCRSARELLRYRGLFCCILPPTATVRFCKIAENFQLGLKIIFPVANSREENAIRVLLAFKKEGKALPEIWPTLELREFDTSINNFVPAQKTLEFCPWLVNQKPE